MELQYNACFHSVSAKTVQSNKRALLRSRHGLFIDWYTVLFGALEGHVRRIVLTASRWRPHRWVKSISICQHRMGVLRLDASDSFEMLWFDMPQVMATETWRPKDEYTPDTTIYLCKVESYSNLAQRNYLLDSLQTQSDSSNPCLRGA